MLEYLINDEMIKTGDRVAVGVSGGADSMLLLWALLDKQKQTDFYLKVINVNHNLRGKESDDDSEFVRKFCEKKKIPCEIVNVDVKKLKVDKKMTLEQAARNARYDAIYSEMKKDKLNKLFLAHHKNDQAETVLMHILRGSGISGACGMRADGKIFRPLLGLKKSEIEKIVNESGIKFVTDSTNSENVCSRNFLRNLVLPEIEKVYPSAIDAICAFSDKCEKVQKFIEKQIDCSLVATFDGGVIVYSRALKNEDFIVREYLKLAFEKLGVFADIEEKHYKLLTELSSTQVNTSIDLPHEIVARQTYDGVKIFRKSKAKEEINSKQFVVGEIEFEGYGKIITKVISAHDVVYGDGSLYIDYNKLPADSEWRLRKNGDKFTMLGTGTKSLSDYFTDEKVDMDFRDKTPVLASKEKVLVIAERDISENVKIDGNTDTIIQITFEHK